MTETREFRLGGGLDVVTPAISKKPGVMISCINHEPRPEGYRRIDGFERYDGRPEPSQASYWVIDFDAGSTAVAEGDEVRGLTSFAVGTAIIAGVVASGTYAAGTAAGYLVLTNVDGTFVDNEPLQVSSATVCTAASAAIETGADTDANNTTWTRDAIETARTAIGKVPGSGPILGVWSYLGDVYVFRDTADATACKMHRASLASGWVEMDLGRTVAFTSGGTYEIADGDTVTGATSAATAVARRVVTTSGTWAAGTAAGRLVLYGQSGTFQSENLDVGANLNVATIAGDSAATTLNAGGLYEFRNHNFFGASGSKRMYGTSGVNPAFEWDGETYVPITTAMEVDTPTHVAAHKNHLFLAFPGGSVQHSGLGEPHVFTVVTGASEIGLGDEITALIDDYAHVLGVMGRNKTAVLYGSSSDDWDLVHLADEAGAVAGTAQVLARPIYLDDQGVRSLASVEQWGDFQASTLSVLVKPWLDAKREKDVFPTTSVRIKTKNQYRLFFDDETGLIVDFSRGPNKPEFGVLDFGLVVRSASSYEDTDGTEMVLFGSDDGYVYRMERGTSFDGAKIEAYFRLAFYNCGSPRLKKGFKGATLEITGEPDVTLFASAEFSYGDADQPAAGEISFDVDGGGGFWEQSNWNEFYWDVQVVGIANARFDGQGTNISLSVASELTYAKPYTVHGVTVHFNPRGEKRSG